VLGNIETGNLAELLMVALTCFATIANILLWFTTRQMVQILIEQVRHQIASSHSFAQHSIVDTHRELFLGLLNNPSLLEHFTQANDLDPKLWELQKVSTFLINQVLIGYLNFRNGIISPSHFEGFKRDAQDVFAYTTVRSHWQKVRLAHSEEFRLFVETELLWCELATEKLPTSRETGSQAS
jgi:hypothetical protein